MLGQAVFVTIARIAMFALAGGQIDELRKKNILTARLGNYGQAKKQGQPSDINTRLTFNHTESEF